MSNTGRKEAEAELKRIALYTVPDLFLTGTGKRGEYICPGCGKSAKIYRSKDTGEYRLKCFHCSANLDPVDIVAMTYKISTTEAFEEALKIYGYNEREGVIHKTVARKKKEAQPTPKKERKPEEIEASKAYILKAATQIEKTRYLARRGISFNTAKKYGVGFEKDYNAGSKDFPVIVPAIVIPFTRYDDNTVSYLYRLTQNYYYEGELQRYRYIKNGGSGLFNAKAVTKAKPVFIVEGAIDAMSISEAGGNAVAIQSISNANAFIKWLEAMQEAGKVKATKMFICLDNDGKEQTAAAVKKIKRGLDKLNIENEIVEDLTGEYKDANEALQKDREFLISEVSRKTKQTAIKQEAERNINQEETMEELKNNVAETISKKTVEEIAKEKEEARLKKLEEQKQKVVNISANGLYDNFRKEIETASDPLPTGLAGVDKILGGGFSKGLYVIGGVSSVGKTTLCLQMADYISWLKYNDGDNKKDRNVLFVSIEQPKYDLMTKSIARRVLFENVKDIEKTKEPEEKITEAKRKATPLPGYSEIRFYNKQDKKTQEIIDKACESYRIGANHLFIFDGSKGEMEALFEAANGITKEIKKGLSYYEHYPVAGRIANGKYKPGAANTIREVYVEQLNKLLQTIGQKIDIVFIDYLQRIRGAKDNYGSDRLEINEVVSELQTISKDYNIPVVVLASLNRAAAKEAGKEGIIEMQSFSGSGGIEYTADYLIALNALEKDKGLTSRVITFDILKNRTGALDKTKILFVKPYSAYLDYNKD